ncbi:MAG: hypothetical protein WKG32_11865 [Gemmatimonadaceae bacterium]
MVAAILGLTLAACADEVAPSGVDVVAASEPAAKRNPHSGAHAEKGYIGGWLHGEPVRLRYTKLYFCEEPPASGAPSGCVVGAPAEMKPRRGPIPPIYAIAAVGIQPDPATLHCPSLCLNHPSTLDLSRIGGPPSAMAGPHSHIITKWRDGWHQTVNIRVRDLAVWNQIAAAKTLAKVRELQADPAVGGAGLISQDTPTNIFFFFQVHDK